MAKQARLQNSTRRHFPQVTSYSPTWRQVIFLVGTPEAMDAYWSEERRLWAALVNETKATLN